MKSVFPPTLARRWRRLRYTTAARALALALLAGASGALIARGLGGGSVAWMGAGVALALLGALVLWRLVRAADRPARDLQRFLEGIRYDDASVRIPARGSALQHDLAEAFRDVGEAFERVRAEREEGAAYLEAVVRHVGVALIAFRDGGAVTLFNPAAGRALGVPRPRSLDALGDRSSGAASALLGLKAGERALVRLDHEAGPQELVAYASQFVLGGRTHTLVSLQDIRAELEARELDAWQQLSRVLTHEITNSVAPIASLAGTARALLPPEASGDVAKALATIERRSRGLVAFVESYRTLAGVPTPEARVVPAVELLGGVATLFRTTAAEKGVTLSVEIDPERMDLVVDPDLVEQAFVNIVLNAIEATGGVGGGHVTLHAAPGPGGRPVIRVVDNGSGIEPEVIERVTVPFFSTKAGGSGIGLALAHRIVRLHGGTLTVRSEPGVETEIALRF